ncbi:MAG TPA: hypothetical protein VKB84_07805 [Candidatus Binataceae bacterium]|nr:hypothetical protein [Candidatus Binataceae bacterium]
MIVLWGLPSDPPLRAAAAQLARLGADYVLVGPDARLARPWSPRAEACLALPGRELLLNDVTAAYLRPQLDNPGGAQERDLMQTMLAWADCTSALVLNRPQAMAPNNSKPLQARWIGRFGLRVPESIVTTDPDCVRSFVARHGDVIYKSISGVRSVVRRLDALRMRELDAIAGCPTLFQRYIPGDDIRVHIIGAQVHALAIRSDRDDYRYAATDGGHVEAEVVQLEPSIAQQLASMAHRMGLLLAGIDLRREPGGELYCLEVNPSPGFTYFERLAGVDLASSVAALLLRHQDP